MSFESESSAGFRVGLQRCTHEHAVWDPLWFVTSRNKTLNLRNLKLLRWSLLPHLQCTGHINWKLTTAGTDVHSMSGHVIIKRIRKAAQKDWASKEMKCCIWIKLSCIDEHYRQLVISCYRKKTQTNERGIMPAAPNPVVTETIEQSSHYRHVSLVFLELRHYLSTWQGHCWTSSCSPVNTIIFFKYLIFGLYYEGQWRVMGKNGKQEGKTCGKGPRVRVETGPAVLCLAACGRLLMPLS